MAVYGKSAQTSRRTDRCEVRPARGAGGRLASPAPTRLRVAAPEQPRYNRLIFAALEAIGDSPALPGYRPVPGVEGVRALHLRYARRLVPQEHQVREPRHLVLYRLAADGAVEVRGLVPLNIGRLKGRRVGRIES